MTKRFRFQREMNYGLYYKLSEYCRKPNDYQIHNNFLMLGKRARKVWRTLEQNKGGLRNIFKFERKMLKE